MKTCSKCGAEKPLTEFRKNRSRADGHHHQCKPCQTASVAASRRKNPDKYRAHNSAWNRAHREQMRAAESKYRAAHPEKAKEKNARRAALPHMKDLKRAIKAKARDLLTDGYVADKLGLSVREAPPALIEAKRVQLAIKRFLKDREGMET